jgi:hypothetical protein
MASALRPTFSYAAPRLMRAAPLPGSIATARSAKVMALCGSFICRYVTARLRFVLPLSGLMVRARW